MAEVFREELFDIVREDSPDRICIAVIGREAFLREAVCEGLKASSLIEVTEAKTLRAYLERGELCNTILYMEPPRNDPFVQDSLDLMGDLIDSNWILMNRHHDSRVLARLAELGVNLSVIPFDISKIDLVHIARLAANERQVLVDRPEGLDNRLHVNVFAHLELSEQQLRLLELLSEGLSNKEIATLEGCVVNTIKMRVRALLTKINAKNRTHAAVLAARAGMRYRSPSAEVPN